MEKRSSASSSTEAIIAQHKRLLQTIEELRGRLNEKDRFMSERSTLRALLAAFLTELQEHFEVESSSTLLLTRELLAPDRSKKLFELDAEHPRLLRAFQRALDCVESSASTSEDIARELEWAISLFCEHEAEEDLLFAHA